MINLQIIAIEITLHSVYCNAKALMSSLSYIVYKNINDKFTMPNINNMYMYSSFQKYFV